MSETFKSEQNMKMRMNGSKRSAANPIAAFFNVFRIGLHRLPRNLVFSAVLRIGFLG
jgi:hypothetical protein